MEQGYTKNSKDVISLTIEGDNYLNQLKINQNLTINNLRATIENELKRKVTITFGNQILDGRFIIKDVLQDEAIIAIKDAEHTCTKVFTKTDMINQRDKDKKQITHRRH